MDQVKKLQNKSIKQLKSLNNVVFSSNVLQHENLNIIVGSIVAILCVAVVQGHLKVPKALNTTASRAIHLFVIVVVARHNLVLALILLTGYMVLLHYSGLEKYLNNKNNNNKNSNNQNITPEKLKKVIQETKDVWQPCKNTKDVDGKNKCIKEHIDCINSNPKICKRVGCTRNLFKQGKLNNEDVRPPQKWMNDSMECYNRCIPGVKKCCGKLLPDLSLQWPSPDILSDKKLITKQMAKIQSNVGIAAKSCQKYGIKSIACLTRLGECVQKNTPQTCPTEETGKCFFDQVNSEDGDISKCGNNVMGKITNCYNTCLPKAQQCCANGPEPLSENEQDTIDLIMGVGNTLDRGLKSISEEYSESEQ